MGTTESHTTTPTSFAVGTTLDVLGDRVTLLASAPETGGTMTVARVVAGPEAGPPPHTHAYAELFVVLRGELEVLLEGQGHHVGPGEVAAVPGGAVHAYRNPGEEPVEFVAVLHPAGFEAFFAELGRPTDAPPAPVDPAHVAAVAARHGVHLLPPA